MRSLEVQLRGAGWQATLDADVRPRGLLRQQGANRLLVLRHHRPEDTEEALRVVQSQKEKTIRQLQDALERVRTLEGIIPICSYCKKIRDDQQYWLQVEQ